MRRSLPYLRGVLLGLATLGVLMLILRWSNPPGSSEGVGRFTTPEACLDTFRDARADGNASVYLRCLGEPLRSQTRRKYRDEQEMGLAIREEMKLVKSWAVKDRPDPQATQGTALVEQVYPSGVRELRLQLERTGEGWLITSIENGKERPASLPYGTAVGEEPEGKK